MFIFIFNYVDVSVPACGNRHVSTGVMEGRTLGSPEPELQVVISCLMWELGIELGSPEKAIH